MNPNYAIDISDFDKATVVTYRLGESYFVDEVRHIDWNPSDLTWNTLDVVLTERYGQSGIKGLKKKTKKSKKPYVRIKKWYRKEIEILDESL